MLFLRTAQRHRLLRPVDSGLGTCKLVSFCLIHDIHRFKEIPCRRYSGTPQPNTNAHRHVKLPLSPEEIELFSMLTSFVKDKKLGTTVRVAGGWVRDKLLGLAGKHDIDIALDNITGKDFATALNAWNSITLRASTLTDAAKTLDPRTGLPIVHFAVIKSNPEQSKHLETATARLGKFSIDFVQLRTDEYNAASRVPTIKFGTPLQDALRRDLTINALFYNVNSGAVEDFTGLGLQDLAKGRICTPLAPLTTLQDDPLRALRAIRFACRLGFDVSEELAAAARDCSVHEALDTKVSRERIYLEVKQMLSQAAPEAAARAAVLLAQLGLLSVVFVLPRATADGLYVRRREGSAGPENAQDVARFIEQFHVRGVNTLLLQTALATSAPTANPQSLYTAELRQLQHLTLSATETTKRVESNAEATPEAIKLLEKSRASDRDILNVSSRTAALVLAAGAWECSPPRRKGGKPMPVSEFILSYSLKMSNEYYAVVHNIIEAVPKFRAMLENLLTYNNRHGSQGPHAMHRPPLGNTLVASRDLSYSVTKYKCLDRETLGLAMREAGPTYVSAVELAVADMLLDALVASQVDASSSQNPTAVTKDLLQGLQDMLSVTLFGTNYSLSSAFHPRDSCGFYENLLSGPHVKETFGDEVLAAGRDLLHGIQALELTADYNAPPLLNGQQLKKRFSSTPNGPVFGEIMKEIVRWTVATPKCARTEEALIAHLKEVFKGILY